MLHLIEGPSPSVLRILSNLAGHKHFFEGGIQGGNIVFTIEDRPRRLFPEWYSGIIPEKKTPADDIREDNCTTVAFDMATRLLNIGKTIQEENQDDLDFARYGEPIACCLVVTLTGSLLVVLI